MVRVVATLYIKSEHIDAAKPLFRELIEETRKEKGCIEYRLHEKEDEPGFYAFIEEWESMEDLKNHSNSEHYKRIVPQVGSFKAKDGAVWKMKEVK